MGKRYYLNRTSKVLQLEVLIDVQLIIFRRNIYHFIKKDKGEGGAKSYHTLENIRLFNCQASKAAATKGLSQVLK